jgi:hypothetical protein
MTMATIGTFTSTENGFTGSIRTPAFNVKAPIASIENPSEGPQFRIFAGSPDLAPPAEALRAGSRLPLGQARRSELPLADLRDPNGGEDGSELIRSRPNRD